MIFTNVEFTPGGADGGVFYRKVPALRLFDQGSPLGAFPPELAPLPGDIVVTKRYASAFFGTHLAQELLSRGARLRVCSRQPERAFRVKPPAWTDSSAGVCAREYHTAKGHGCSLVVVLASKGWRWAVYTRRDGGDGGGVCESLEHGKRLAEAWYVAEVTRNMEEVR